jgi:hypothetical protein
MPAGHLAASRPTHWYGTAFPASAGLGTINALATRRSNREADRQPVTRCFESLDGDQSATLQFDFETCQDISKHCDDLRGAPPLQPDTNYRRPLCARDRQKRVEIRVERYDYRTTHQRQCRISSSGALLIPISPTWVQSYPRRRNRGAASWGTP